MPGKHARRMSITPIHRLDVPPVLRGEPDHPSRATCSTFGSVCRRPDCPQHDPDWYAIASRRHALPLAVHRIYGLGAYGQGVTQ